MKYIITTKKRLTKLKSVIIDLDISQTSLAKEAGLHNRQISVIASGTQDVTLRTAKKICNALELRLDEVFGDGVTDVKTDVIQLIDVEISKLSDNHKNTKATLEYIKNVIIDKIK